MYVNTSSDAPKLVALCGACEVQRRKSVITKVIGEQVIISAGTRGSALWPVLTDPQAAIASDPALRAPEAVVAHRRAVREGKAEPLPGVTVTKQPRTRWVVLSAKRQKVYCRFGHPTQIEKIRLLAMSRSRSSVLLDSRGHASDFVR